MRSRFKQPVSSKDSDKDKESKKRVGLILCFYVGIVFIAFVVLVSVLVATTSSTAANVNELIETIEEPSRLFQCPELQEAGQGAYDNARNFEGGTLCSDDNGEMYYFYTNNTGSSLRYMRYVNVTETGTLILGDNVIPPDSTYPGGIITIVGCVWNPYTNAFMVTDQNCANFYTLSKDGTSASVYGTTNRECFNGMAFTENNTRLFVHPTYGGIVDYLYEFDPVSTVQVGDSIPLSIDTDHPDGSQNAPLIFGMATDPTTGYVLVSYKYKSFGSIVEFFASAALGILREPDTGMIETSCVQSNAHIVKSFTFDSEGRIFMNAGGRDDYNFYRLDYAPFPANYSASETFTLNCSGGTLLTIDEFSNANETTLYNVVGDGCDIEGTVVYDATQIIGVESDFYQTTQQRSANNIQTRTVKRAVEMHTDGYAANVTSVNIQPIIPNATEIIAQMQQELFEDSNSTGKRTVGNAFTFLEHAGFPGPVSTSQNTGPSNFLRIDPVTLDWVAIRYGGTSGPWMLVEGFNAQNALNFISLSPSAPGVCASPAPRGNAWYDRDADRYVAIWPSSGLDTLCVAVSATSSVSGAYNYYSFIGIASSMNRLDFTIWGDYYNVCWNNGADRARCYVLERSNVLSGASTPRLVAIPRPSIVEVDGYQAVATPLHRHQDGIAKGPTEIAYPCGVISTITAEGGGLINLRTCEAVNFDTMMITVGETITSIGTWDDGTNRTLSLLKQIPLDYEHVVTYRHFPNEANIERVVYAWTVSERRETFARIRMAKFKLNMDATLTVEIPPEDQTFQRNAGSAYAVFNPTVALTQTNKVVIQGYAQTGNTNRRIIPFRTFAMQGFDFFDIVASSPSTSGLVATWGKDYIYIPDGLQYTFGMSHFLGSLKRSSIFKMAPWKLRRKGIAFDACNRTASCFSDITISYSE